MFDIIGCAASLERSGLGLEFPDKQGKNRQFARFLPVFNVFGADMGGISAA